MQETEPSQSPQNTKNLRPYIIVLIIEFVLIVALAIANIALFFSSPKPGTTTTSSTTSTTTQTVSTSPSNSSTEDDVLNSINNITKDEAINTFKAIHNDEEDSLDKFVPDELLKLRDDETSLSLIPSYDDVSEVFSIARDRDEVMNLYTNSNDDFQIDKTTDQYTIISVNPSKITCGGLNEMKLKILCFREISFNKKAFNYSRGESKMIFNDLSPDFVEFVFKTIMSIDNKSGGSLYDFYFKENDDNFTLTGIYYGIGIDTENAKGYTSASDLPYVINIYEKKLVLDKTTKEAAWEEYNSPVGKTKMNVLKSIQLSSDEATELLPSVKNS